MRAKMSLPLMPYCWVCGSIFCKKSHFLSRLFLALAFMLPIAPASADSFTFFGTVSDGSTSDFTISYPWSASMDAYNAACGGTCAGAALIGAGPAPTGCYFITRVAAWNGNGTGAPVMVGKADVAGTGGDYLTPIQAYPSTDSGWYPRDLRPLFKPGDELHIHTSIPATLALATIFYKKTAC